MKADLDIPDLSNLRPNTVWFAVMKIFVASGPDDYSQYALVGGHGRVTSFFTTLLHINNLCKSV